MGLGVRARDPVELFNSNYLLLGAVVEAVSGESLADFLSAEVFTPWAWTWCWIQLGPVPTLALSYMRTAATTRSPPPPKNQTGDGSIQTTPSQLVIWADNYSPGRGRPGVARRYDGAGETG